MDSLPTAPPVLERIAAISGRIGEDKYRLKRADGTPIDVSIEDTWRRVARTLASVEQEPALWEERFYAVLEDFQFLPAGRIVAGAGTQRRVTLFNCFVMGEIPDDLGGIFDHLREATLTLQQGGGIGYDFSTLRPKGALVRGVEASASGPVSFMNVWDAMCGTIMSAGARRGAMMATLRCDHPDIEAFVAAKREPGRLKNFNLSVLATDRFMAAVEADAPWDLVFGGEVFRTTQARALWDLIMAETYDHAEPGVLFIDRINGFNNLGYCESIQATNPCGELPLPPYGACLLGSVNLARFVRFPFTPNAHLDLDAVRATAAIAVRMLDNAIDASGFPLEAQRAEAQAKRRIGLGITGLANALMMVGLRYGAEEAASEAARWMTAVNEAAYRASAALSVEKGPFPAFDHDAFLGGAHVARLDPRIRGLIAAHGLRNGVLTSIAPTGTISIFADNVSSGIEPVFAHSAERTVLQADGSRRTETVEDHGVRLYRAVVGADAALPDHFVTAEDLSPADHVRMQAALQPHVDSAISKTVNVAVDISFDAFKDVYLEAYRSGCKGCTTYRPNDITGSVLATPAPGGGSGRSRAKRPKVLTGATTQFHWGEDAYYFTLNDRALDGSAYSDEVFINSKNLESQAWTVALTRVASAVARRYGDASFIADELAEIHDPRGGQWLDGRYVPSLPAAIGLQWKQHVQAVRGEAEEGAPAAEMPAAAPPQGAFCPRCSQPALVREGSCCTCHNCGFSTCS